MRRAAFTLIEMLIVVAIIALLASLMIVGAGIIKRNMIRTKSATIVATVHTAIEHASSTRGMRAAPSEHPLAGSAATDILSAGGAGSVKRALFYRNGTSDPTDLSKEALKVNDIGWVAGGDRDRVLLPDDVYAGHMVEGDTPLLFGLKRQQIGCLYASSEWITTWRNLPRIDGPYRDPNNTSQLITPYDNTRYRDGDFLYRPQLAKEQTLEEASQRQLETMLSTHLDELGDFGAIKKANEADDENWIQATITPKSGQAYDRKIDVKEPKKGSYDATHRVWIPPEEAAEEGDEYAEVLTAWWPGYHRVGNDWYAYRLRGHSVIDAYGTELLFWQDDRKHYLIMSAGPDGVFAVDPGDDGELQTKAEDFDPSDPGSIDPGDKDGSRDNIGSLE